MQKYLDWKNHGVYSALKGQKPACRDVSGMFTQFQRPYCLLPTMNL